MLVLPLFPSCHAPWHCAQNAENPTFVVVLSSMLTGFPPKVMVAAAVLYEFCVVAAVFITGQILLGAVVDEPPVALPPTPPTYDVARSPKVAISDQLFSASVVIKLPAFRFLYLFIAFVVTAVPCGSWHEVHENALID